MSYGDPSYELSKSGSVAYATTALGQSILLTDNSLSSTFNPDDVWIVDVELTGANTLRIAPSSLSNNFGITFTAASAKKTLPAMKGRNIENLRAYNLSASANASANFLFWRRLP